MSKPPQGFRPGPYDVVFERDRADGSHERLVLVGGVCRNPECPCRDLNYYGYLVPGTGIKDLEGRDLGERVLDVSLNVDTGKLGAVRQGPPEMVQWLETELPDTDMGAIRRGFDEVRAILKKHSDEEWKELDWSYWEPGMRVTWVEAHPSLGSEVIEIAGRKFFLLDTYCVTEECRCQEVVVTGIEIINGEEAVLPTLSATVIPGDPKSLDLDCAPGDRALAERIWEKWSGDEDVYAKLARRQQWMMTLGAELSRRWRDRRKPVVQEKKPAPNQGCPCGSGKKYKRCCGR